MKLTKNSNRPLHNLFTLFNQRHDLVCIKFLWFVLQNSLVAPTVHKELCESVNQVLQLVLLDVLFRFELISFGDFPTRFIFHLLGSISLRVKQPYASCHAIKAITFRELMRYPYVQLWHLSHFLQVFTYA